MIKLFDLNDFEDLLGDSVDILTKNGTDLNDLFESFREPGRNNVELDWNDFRKLLKLVTESTKEQAYKQGYDEGVYSESLNGRVYDS